MRFGLTTWVGDGTVGNEFRPSGVDGTWAVIDLRADSTQQAGLCFYAAEAIDRSQVATDLGEESLDDDLSPPVRRAVANALGVDLGQSPLRAIIAELLILHGKHDGTRWKPLKEDRRGRHRVVMLGRVLYDAPVPQGATITDDFNRANQSGLGTSSEGWSWSAVKNNWEIVSNSAESESNNNTNVVRADSALDSDDHYAQGVVSKGTGAGAVSAGMFLRMPSNNAESGYASRVNDSSGGQTEISKVTTGSYSQLASGTFTYSNGLTLRGEVDGSTIRLLVDAVEELSTTDTTFSGQLYTGLFAFDNLTNVDNFEAGDLAEPPAPTSPLKVLRSPRYGVTRSASR